VADITKYLNVRKGRSYQINASVPEDRAQEIADALEFLKMRDVTRSRSALVCDAIVGHAVGLGFEPGVPITESDADRAVREARERGLGIADLIEAEPR